jgi:hypothetical protein
LVEEVSGEVREAADARARLRVMLAPLHASESRTSSTDDPGVA